MLTPEQVAAYHREGFGIARGFFAADEIDLLRRVAREDRALDRHADSTADVAWLDARRDASARAPAAGDP